jgi:hypothetical protein
MREVNCYAKFVSKLTVCARIEVYYLDLVGWMGTDIVQDPGV